jgi:hypothetical protein
LQLLSVRKVWIKPKEIIRKFGALRRTEWKRFALHFAAREKEATR